MTNRHGNAMPVFCIRFYLIPRRHIMKRYRQYIFYLAVFAALASALYLLMVFSAAIPNTAIKKNMHSSAKLYMDSDRYAFSEDGFLKNVTDNHADQMWLNIGWNMGSGEPFRSALDTRYYDGEDFGTTAGLYLTVTRGKAANADYTRYWHGTAGLMRILHLFTNIGVIKGLCFFCLRVFLLLRLNLHCFCLRFLLLLCLSLHCFRLRLLLGLRIRVLASSAGTAAAHKERHAQADHNYDCHILFHN
jgi:hypothetical protein